MNLFLDEKKSKRLTQMRERIARQKKKKMMKQQGESHGMEAEEGETSILTVAAKSASGDDGVASKPSIASKVSTTVGTRLRRGSAYNKAVVGACAQRYSSPPARSLLYRLPLCLDRYQQRHALQDKKMKMASTQSEASAFIATVSGLVPYFRNAVLHVCARVVAAERCRRHGH